MVKNGSAQDDEYFTRGKYLGFLVRVASSGILWGVWCGKTWATAKDPSGVKTALFLTWESQEAAFESFRKNAAKFPEGATVDSIVLDKWLDLYTVDLISANAAVFVNPDSALRGVVVDPKQLCRDLLAKSKHELKLQGSDLVRLKTRVLKKRKQKQVRE